MWKILNIFIQKYNSIQFLIRYTSYLMYTQFYEVTIFQDLIFQGFQYCKILSYLIRTYYATVQCKNKYDQQHNVVFHDELTK